MIRRSTWKSAATSPGEAPIPQLRTTSPGINLRKQGTDPTVNEFHIQGLSPSPTGTPNVENFVNSQNTSTSGTFGVGGTALLSAQTGFTTTGPFLLAADTGVASTVTTDSDPQLSDPDPVPPALRLTPIPRRRRLRQPRRRPRFRTPPTRPRRAVEAPTGTVSVQLSQAELDAIVAAAIARWSATGLTAEQVAALERHDVHGRRHVGAQSRLVLAGADHARCRRRRPRLVPRRHARSTTPSSATARARGSPPIRPRRRPGTTTCSPP